MCIEFMTNIEKPKFNILDVSGNNYLSWCLDVELHLQVQGLVETLVKDGDYIEKDEANALIFIHRQNSISASETTFRSVEET